MNAVARAFGDRLRRADLRAVPVSHARWIVACWVLVLLVAVVVLVPGLADGILTAALGVRVLLVAAIAVLAGTLALTLRPGDGSPVGREIGLAVLAGSPALLLAADRLAPFAIAAGGLFVVAEVAARLPGPRTRAGELPVALLIVAAWTVLLAAQFTPGSDRGWTWIALFGLAAAFAAFGSYYAVARAAESRVGWMRPVLRDDLPTAAAAGLVGAAVVVATLRLTVARDLFPDPDPRLWSPLDAVPTSWLHAAAVAALVVGFAARSVRDPLRRSGERGMTAALALAGNAQLVLGALVLLVGLVVAAATGAVFAPGIPPLLVAVLKFVGVVAITGAALLPPFRGTAARALAVVTGAYLLPLTLLAMLGRAGVVLPAALAGLPATPVQVALLLLIVAGVGVALPALRRMLGPGLVVRLAVVPLVAVHAGWLLPAAWSDLGRVVLVVGVIIALLLLLPRPSADRERRGLDLLAASGGQLLALVVFVLALPSLIDDPQLVVLGVFWLSVPVMTALTVSIAEDDPTVAYSAGSRDASRSAYSATRSRKSVSLGP